MGVKKSIIIHLPILLIISIISVFILMSGGEIVHNQSIIGSSTKSNTPDKSLFEPPIASNTQIASSLIRNINIEKKKKEERKGNLFTIPVIVHIIHDPSVDSNIYPYPDDDDVISGVEWINNLLAGGPACPGDPASVATEIRLCLATRDINGAPTTGINRFPNGLTDMDLCHDDLALKSIPKDLGNLFPDTCYLNLYIVRGIRASCQPGDSLAGGYAAYPAAHGTSYDGIVLEAVTWMHHDCNVRKVILHELGHYFNLKHTWEGNSCINENCLTDGDGVCDTPPDFDINIYASNSCIQGMPVNTCFSDVNPSDPNNPFLADQPDMTSNLMDYAPPACISVFTAGQAERIIQTLEGPRSSLLNSKGCDLPCQTPITLDIDWPSTPIIFGSPVTITQSSQGASSYKWSWYEGESSNQDLFYPADSIGIFEVCMEAIGDTPECNATECYVMEVVCAQPVPTISLSDYQVDPNETVWLTHTSPSQSGFSYTWFINGEPHGQGNSISYTPEVQGSAAIWLEACRLGCCSESEHAYLSVGACPTGKEANHWMFGRDRIHLDWNSGSPIEQPASAAYSDEATAVAIDGTGSLLFYSDNERVFKRDHQEMTNGRLRTYSTGGSSSTHCITIPQPGSDSLWYLFYPEQLKSSDPGRDTITTLYYAIVDMSLEGGNGDVILKDQNILRPTTEKVAAVRHCNGTDWWIVAHEAGNIGTNRFFAWLLTNDGLSMPVISTAGLPKARTEFTKLGEMNISPDGLMISMSTGPDFDLEPIPNYTIELFDFDPAFGTVTNAIFIGDFKYQTAGLGLADAYGLEFSPSGNFLYVARAAWDKDSLLQYDLRSGNPTTILQSRENIYQSDNPTDDSFGAMLTGPNDQIYIIDFSSPKLNVIRYPDRKGIAAEFDSHGIDLQRGDCFLGLPTFPAGTNTPGKPFIKGPNTLCDTLMEAKYYIGGNCRYQDYDWQVEGTSRILRTDGDTVWIKPGQPGIDILSVTKYTACGTKHDTFEIQIEPCKIVSTSCNIDFTWNEADTVICQGEDAFLRFYTQAPFVQYTLTSEGNTKTLTSPMLVIPTPQADDLVTIHLSTPDGCDTTISVGIHVNPPLEATFLEIDSLVCSGESAQINLQHLPNHLVEIFSADLGWVITNPTWPLDFGPISIDTTLFIRIRDQQMSCDSFFRWHVRIDNIQPETYDTLFICDGDSIEINSEWYSTDTVITESFTRIGCDSLHHTQIWIRPPLEAEINIQGPCQNANGSITIQMTSGIAPFLYSINNGLAQSEPYFDQLSEGTFIIKVIDAQGCVLDTRVNLIEGMGIAGLNAIVKDASCDQNNGSIILHTNSPGVLYAFNGSAFTEDSVYLNLLEGHYSVVAMHPAGCMDTIFADLIQTGKPKILDIVSAPAHCGRADGSILVSVIEGGVDPYFIGLNSQPFDTLTHFPNLVTGQYTIFISDSVQCTLDTSIFVSHLLGPVISDISVIPALCGLPQGSIALSVVDTNFITYQINNEPLTLDPIFSSLLPGSYALSVTDSAGCSVVQSVVVPDSFSFTLEMIEISDAHCAESDGSINLHVSGGPINVSIEEMPGQTFNNDINGLPEGTYHLQIRDEWMCTLDTVIQVESVCEIYLPNVFSPNGDVVNDVFGIVQDIPLDSWALTIFDRSGNMVFYSDNPLLGWNGEHHGKSAQSGVFTWTIRYKLSTDQQIKDEHGSVTVLR